MEGMNDSAYWINKSTIGAGMSFSGNNLSKLDSLNPFSLGYRSEFPEICRNKNLTIIIGEYVKLEDIDQELSLILTISYGDSVIVWESKKVNSRVKTRNTWTPVTDEFDVPASLTGRGYMLSVYLWNHDNNLQTTIDDLSIEFREKKMLSFIPGNIPPGNFGGEWNQISSSGNISFLYNAVSENIIITSGKEDTLIKSLRFLSEWYEGNKEEKKTSWINSFKLNNKMPFKDGDTLTLNGDDPVSNNVLTIFISEEKLHFDVTTTFKKKVKLYRHTFLAGFGIPVREVYNKKTLSISENLKEEYWLENGGFRLTGKRNSIVMYRPGKASSVQLDLKNNIGLFNLDFAHDHPMLHFPLLKKSEGKYIDYSGSVYNKGDIIRASFIFFVTDPDFKQINIMNNPDGYLSSMVWTEHADYTDLRTHKAVYLGSENINSLNESTGGFLRNSIPVTKSIFYSNPDNVDNSEKAGFMPGPVANFQSTEGYLNFLKLLDESGIEICLHTPDHYTTDRKLLSESMDRMKREFVPVSWIDHGYDNSERSNREDLNCDGADSTSKWYAGDLWRKYGIKYFWNSFFEDSGIYSSFSYNSFFSVPYSGWDEAMPTPLYWKHPTRTGDIIHWKTVNTLDPPDGSLWDYYFNDVRLNDMINNRNDIILHCYPARLDSSTGFYDFRNGKVVVNDNFNKALAKLSLWRTEGKIRLVTIRDLLNYRTSLENISYEIKSGDIVIANNGKEFMRGLSFSTEAKEIEIDNKVVSKKTFGDNLIFWLDLAPGEQITIEVK